MMKRPLARPLIFAVAFLLGASTIASADPLPPIKETVDPLVGSVLQTQALGIGDLDPTSLIVSDADLASVGVVADVQSLIEDPQLLIVDDDKAQCPNAQFDTAAGIQLAIAAAPVGGKIRVCPGIYSPISIPKTLTLQAPRYQGQATECQSPGDDPTKNAIIQGANGTALVLIGASNVVFDGFTVRNNPLSVGIYTVPSESGYEIAHNIVQNNVFGLYFNSSGASVSVARQNCFRANVQPGASNGNGVYSDAGLRNAKIQDNYFTGHFIAAINLTGAVAVVSDVEVTHNESIDDTSIALLLVSNVVVNYNKVVRSNGTAIFVSGGVGPAEIGFNQLQDGTGNGISLNTVFSAAPNQNIRIKSNHVSGFLGSGIRLGDNAQSNTVETNRSDGNRVDGIRATALSGSGGATPNIIQNNSMRSNTEHDCHDDSTGPNNAPALVANQWINDLGQTENKVGLCKHAS
jgi:hypothetical protein